MAPPAGHIRPGRYLGTFAVIVVALYALVFGTGNHQPTPRLGIDLKGGTTVTLTARTLNGQPPNAQQLAQATQIINSRVNGLGVSGAQVISQGNNIIITVPGSSGEEAKTLGETARLYLRPVTQTVAATPPPAPSTTKPPTTGTPTTGTSSHPTSSPSSPATPTTGTSKAQGLGAPGAAGGIVLDANVAAAASTTTPTTPTTTPSSTPTTSSASGASTAVNPNDCWGISPQQKAQEAPLTAQQQAQLITDCRLLRQSGTATTQQAALTKLNCGPAPGGGIYYDPLVGNDDPTKPLVACDQNGQYKYILAASIIDGTQITNANSGANPNGAGFVINLTFNGPGTSIWSKYTAANIGKVTAWTLDSQVVSAATIQGAITGQTMISGNFTQVQAQNLANVLKYGSLPLAFDVSNAQTVSATLGLSSLQAGLIAGGIGLILVVLYCLAYYRALGVLTVLSLVLSGVTVYAVLVLLGRWIGYSLDLAGIAGFIIAIGITADSFVILFERLKDEVREGRTFRSAVPRAWVRARRTILASDAVSFLAAVVLYIIAVSDVQGFAFTLGMSTVLDLLIVFLVTHPLVVLASRSKTLSKPSMSGLGAVQRAGAALRATKATTPATAGVKEA